MDPLGAARDLLKMGADSIQIFQITARANRPGTKISAKQLLQHRTAARIAKLADAQPGDSQNPAANGLPTLGQFQRNRRTGSKTALH
jgi:aryl carrier-like protein